LRQPKLEHWSTFDLVEAFHLAHALLTLHQFNILASLARPSTAEAVAGRHGLDPALMRGTLEYVAARTDLLRKKGAKFATTRRYSNESRFLLNLYAGAYRPNAIRLAEIMRKPWLASDAVNRTCHARTFESSNGSSLRALAALIRQLEFTHLLDIGCASGGLLLQLAAEDSKFAGWGIELNSALCRAARSRIRAARLERRVHVFEGDSRHLRSVLPPEVRDNIRSVTACQVANEMFRAGTGRVVAWLRGIRKMLPGRPLLISDYYGRLGTDTKGQRRQTLLHDFAQLISGQGIPPTRLSDWRAIYADAGCRLAHVIEDKATTRFIHVLVL
jgi:SAM-dependent methyltransferase